MHGIFQQALRGEVLSENAKGKIAARQLLLPVHIVPDGIAVNRFVFAAVNFKVGLAVALQIQLAKSDAARNGLLEDAGGDRRAVPLAFARETDADGDELHASRAFPEQAYRGRTSAWPELDVGLCRKDTDRGTPTKERK